MLICAGDKLTCAPEIPAQVNTSQSALAQVNLASQKVNPRCFGAVLGQIFYFWPQAISVSQLFLQILAYILGVALQEAIPGPGIMRVFLVYPTYMVYLYLLPTVQLFNAFHRGKKIFLQKKHVRFFHRGQQARQACDRAGGAAVKELKELVARSGFNQLTRSLMNDILLSLLEGYTTQLYAPSINSEGLVVYLQFIPFGGEQDFLCGPTLEWQVAGIVDFQLGLRYMPGPMVLGGW
ncbi:hypothetical protein DFH07DRAFT_1014529 [Mycena maculata]|uniref:Uncharacterized protein n=1 Tax=Mycena maculata TaxID=230809 RepID=A0AAD7JJ95_9AGAR|nr:hypothetical protein DFH07DRAFT_1014529 [Mycena maculata]